MGCVGGTLDLQERGERGGDGDEKSRKREGRRRNEGGEGVLSGRFVY